MKTINITGNEIVQLIRELHFLKLEKDVPILVAKYIMDNLEIITPAFSKLKESLNYETPQFVLDFEAKRAEIVKKYAARDNKGQIILNSPTSLQVTDKLRCEQELHQLKCEDIINFYQKRKEAETKLLAKKTKIKIRTFRPTDFATMKIIPGKIELTAKYLIKETTSRFNFFS